MYLKVRGPHVEFFHVQSQIGYKLIEIDLECTK